MPIPLLLAAAPSIIQGISGLSGLGKANRRARNLKYPIEQVNPLLQQNAAIAENMGRVGLPQQQYNNSLNNIMRNQAGALTMFGRNPQRTNLASLLRGTNDATMNLDAQDAQARNANQRFAIGQRGVLANEQNRVWDWNNRKRYQMEAASIAQQAGAAKQNMFGGLQGLTNLGMMGLAGGAFGNGDSQSYISGNPLLRGLGIGRKTPQEDLPYLDTIGVNG